MSKWGVNKILLLVLVISTFATVGVTAMKRNQIERSSNTVEIIMEYSDIDDLASGSGYSTEEWLKVFDDANLTTVSIIEDTLADYIDRKGIHFNVSKVIINSENIYDTYPQTVVDVMTSYDENSLVMKTRSDEDYDYIVNVLSYYDTLNYYTEKGETENYIIIEQTEENVLYEKTGDIVGSTGVKNKNNTRVYGTDVLDLPVGFNEEYIKNIRETDMMLLLRPRNYTYDPKGAFDLFDSEVKKHGMDSKLLFFYDDMLGYDYTDVANSVEKTSEYIKNNGYVVPLTETVSQLGHFELSGYDEMYEDLTYDKYVRLFNVWDYVASRYQYYVFYDGGQEIGNSIFRAVTERNTHAVHMRPFTYKSGQYVKEPVKYTEMFNELMPRLESHGYTFGNASPFEEFEVSQMMKTLMGIQLVGYAVLLLNLLVGKIKYQYNLIMFAVLGVLVALCNFIVPNLYVAIASLAACLVFSVLATTVYMQNALIDDSKKKGYLTGALYLMVAVAIGILGGLFVGSFQFTTRYLLEFDHFRGVKVSITAPILIVGLLVIVLYVKQLASENNGKYKNEIVQTVKVFLNTYIKVSYVIVMMIFAIFVVLLLGRSGNANIEPLTAELMMRNFLENHLLARPRNKEFLFSYPLMVVGCYYAGRKFLKKDLIIKYIYIMFFGVASIIGTSSITNSFSHIRTPLYMSVARTVYALVFGLVIAIVYIAVIELCIWVCKKIGEWLKD